MQSQGRFCARKASIPKCRMPCTVTRERSTGEKKNKAQRQEKGMCEPRNLLSDPCHLVIDLRHFPKLIIALRSTKYRIPFITLKPPGILPPCNGPRVFVRVIVDPHARQFSLINISIGAPRHFVCVCRMVSSVEYCTVFIEVELDLWAEQTARCGIFNREKTPRQDSQPGATPRLNLVPRLNLLCYVIKNQNTNKSRISSVRSGFTASSPSLFSSFFGSSALGACQLLTSLVLQGL